MQVRMEQCWDLQGSGCCHNKPICWDLALSFYCLEPKDLAQLALQVCSRLVCRETAALVGRGSFHCRCYHSQDGRVTGGECLGWVRVGCILWTNDTSWGSSLASKEGQKPSRVVP